MATEQDRRKRRPLRMQAAPIGNPFEVLGAVANPSRDSRVVLDVPAQAERTLSALAGIFAAQKAAREFTGVDKVLNPIGAAINTFGPMLDDPKVAQSLGFKLDMPAVKAAGYRTPNFGSVSKAGSRAGADMWGGGDQPPSGPNVALAAPFSGGPVGLDQFRAAIVQQESRGNYAARNRDTGAMGAYQVMPETGRVLAGRLGLPWRPDLMTSNTPEGRQYQDAVGNAAVKEAYEYGGGDVAKAAMYYHGGSNQKIWGPKTRQYASEIGQRLGGAGGLMNPFDSSAPYMDQALGAVRAGTQAALQPFTVNAKMPDAPEFPDAPQLPKRDFNETDQLLQAMKPVFMDEVRQKKIGRAHV